MRQDVSAAKSSMAPFPLSRAEVDNRFATVSDLVTRNHDALTDIKREIAGFRRDVDKRFDAVDTRFDGIENQMASMNAKLDNVAAQMAAINAKLDGRGSS